MAKCPRCGRGGVSYESCHPHVHDTVAVCNFVRRCQWRMLIKGGGDMTRKQLDRIVDVRGPVHARNGE